MTTPPAPGASLSHEVAESLVDKFIADDEFLARIAADNAFKFATAQWRDGRSIRVWRALGNVERRRIVRRIVRAIVAPGHHEPATVPPPAPTRSSTPSRGFVVACADGCGEFVPARGPRPVMRYADGHENSRRP